MHQILRLEVDRICQRPPRTFFNDGPIFVFQEYFGGIRTGNTVDDPATTTTTMGKKSKRNRSSIATVKQQTTSSQEQQQRRAPPALRRATLEEETKDNLRFEDPFIEEVLYDDNEDEWEDDDDDDDDDVEQGDDMKPAASAASADNKCSSSSSSNMMEEDGGVVVTRAWNPLTGDALQPGEALEMDAAAYKMHHAFTAEWPCLSFCVVLPDHNNDEYGLGFPPPRTRFPHTVTAAVGTQADRPERNSLTVLRVSDMAKVRVETEDDILGEEYNNSDDKNDDDSEDSDDDDDDDDDDEEMEPVMEHYSIPHYGGVNRVRAMPQRPDIVATWSDVGTVNLFNVEAIRQRLALHDTKGNAGKNGGTMADTIPTKPFYSYCKNGSNNNNNNNNGASSASAAEGFAMDWSPVAQGHFVTGDCEGSIRLWTPRSDSSSYAVSVIQSEQQHSVEDLQWSPTEATVFGAAECGGTVSIFDTRAPGKAMLSHMIHNNSGVDVNVLSWNKLVSNLLATGGDDGTLAVWDLRHFSNNNSSSNSSKKPEPLARFTPHKTPITSVEWHPTDESMLAASDDVGAYIYDLSVEEDDTAANTADGGMDVPPQLLFVHCGSEQFKEVHWHPQITSCLMTTALTGFSVFIPSNL